MVLYVIILQNVTQRNYKYLQNSNGPSTDPWGTPQVSFLSLNLTPSMITA